MPDPHVIAVVSGKGGVGKTMLSVAIANELALSEKTILIDLDFFNRGLTGLLASKQSQSRNHHVRPPKFIKRDDQVNWSLGEVTPNLFVLYFGDLEKSQIDVVEQLDSQTLSNELRAYVSYLAREADAKFVVLDCHGGPDNASFAACAAASRTVLVSEPDRITLHGTLNFLRNLRQRVPGIPIDIRLVFNKVVAAFSSLFLFRFYSEHLKSEFDDRELLAIIPLELQLTKEFEKTPFLTSVYPQSQLAVKTRLALHDMFAKEASISLPPRVSAMAGIERWLAKYYMGRWPRLLNLDFALKAIAIYAIVVFGTPWLVNAIIKRVYGESVFDFDGKAMAKLFPALIAPLVISYLWVVILILANWTRELEISATYYIRTRAVIRAILAYGTLGTMWVGLSIGLGAVGGSAWKDLNVVAAFMATIIFFLPTAVLASFFAWRGVRDIRFDGAYGEGGLRIAFGFIMISAFLGSAIAVRVG